MLTRQLIFSTSAIAVRLLWLLALAASLTTTLAATFTVTSINDTGPGSLRQAVFDANTNVGLDTIAFNIAGPPYTIILGAPSILITNPVIVDGFTQPGASANTLTNGNDAVLLVEVASISGGYGLTITGGDSAVRGLVFNGFQRCIWLDGEGDNLVEGNFLGLEPNGTNVSPRATGIGVYSTTTNGVNTIGGLTPGARNVISGCDNGISIAGNASVNVVQGNFLGTDRHGTRAVFASASFGITLQTAGNLIGGPLSAARNLISGHQTGLRITTSQARSNVVQGNFIGTDVTGTVSLSNIFAGITLAGASNIVGGLTLVPGQPPGNLISGNFQRGLELSGSDHVIQGNLIGTDLTGTNRLRNGGDGLVADAFRTLIGGTNAGAGNVISGNGNHGINITSSSVTNTVIAANWIGTDATGTLNLSNASHGIRISGASRCTVGPANVLAFNGGNGVAVQAFSAIQNLITANSIYANSLLGIDLANGNVLDGVSPNDGCDADSSLPNQWQNYPVLTNAASTPVSTTMAGYLPSTANAVFRLEFFASHSADASGNGEGRTYLGFTTITNGAGCTNSFSVTLPVGALGGEFITATATDTNGNTSEFSAAVTATGAPATPVLIAMPAGAGQVEISWIPHPLGWILQERLSLTSGSWSNSPSGWTNPIVVPASVPTKFYRLFKP